MVTNLLLSSVKHFINRVTEVWKLLLNVRLTLNDVYGIF